MKNINRRHFLTATSLTVLGGVLSGNAAFASFVKPSSLLNGVQVGAITYSFRSTEGDITNIIQNCKDAGITAIELMGDRTEAYVGKPQNPIDFSKVPFVRGEGRQFTDEQREQMAQFNKDVVTWRSTVSMKPFKKVKKMFKKAGVNIYAFKPRAFGSNNTDAEIEYGMRAAKALGAKSITLELPRDSAQSKRLGDLGAKNGMYIGYHAHLQATDTFWDEALAQSSYNSLNLDIGHYIAAGGNNTAETLLKLIEDKHDRISSIHIKDRKTKANGGENVVWGEGDTPIKEVLQLLRDKGYDIPCTIELEYPIPDDSDAVKEVKRCVEFAKACLV